MNCFKTLFLLFLLILGCLKLPKHYAEWTSGFRLSSCHLDLPNRPEWEPKRPDPHTLLILSQPFSLYQRGSQAYVFLSQDRQYVLKIFAKPLKNYVFPYRFHLRFHHKPQEPYRTLIEKGARGYHLASKLPPFATGLIYTHLNITNNLLPSIPLRDAFGRRYTLPLDGYRFVLQRTCKPLTLALTQSARTNPKQTQQLIQSYFKTISLRASFDIKNCDTEFKKNFGVLDGKVVEFDCGEYAPLAPEQQELELATFQDRIRYWIERHLPQYSEWVDCFKMDQPYEIISSECYDAIQPSEVGS